jgi:thiol-disulfide isomerase/thioredoxin
MKRNAVIFGAVGLLFAVGGAFFGMRQFEPVPPEAPAVSNMFSQTLSDANGQSQPLSQWKNKTLVVNFWATWCAPCVDEMPELSALQTEVALSNVQILGIGIDSATNIAQFASKYKITYPLYTGGLDATELSRQFGNKAGGLPFTVLVGRDGQVKKTYLGRLKMDELRKDLGSL